MNFRRRGHLFVPEQFGILHSGRYLEGIIDFPRIHFRGFVKVELIDAASGRVKRTLEFENLITNAALDYVGNATGNIGKGQFAGELLYAAGCGTGSTTPAVTDTALVAEIAPASSNRSVSVGAGVESETYNGTPEYFEYSHVREFTTAQANGNLTEIGWFSATSGGTMWMRQLFKDGTGTPTTVVKTNADILRVTYKTRIYPPASDATGSLTISGTSYSWTLRPANSNISRAWGSGDGTNWGLMACMGSAAGFFTRSTGVANAYETNTLGARTSIPSGTPAASTGDSVAAYTNGNFYRDWTTVWSTAVANFATGIGSITFPQTTGAQFPFQESFSPKFAKDNTKVLTLVHRFSWGRYP